jgi:phosphate transport system substrate-binding protein
MKKLTPVLLALALLCACAPQGGRSSSALPRRPPHPGETFVFTRRISAAGRLHRHGALRQAIASVQLGESRENVADLIHFSKTTGAYNALMAGEADLCGGRGRRGHLCPRTTGA